MRIKDCCDVELWKLFIKGDDSACAEIYHRFYPLLYSYGIRMTRNRELVLDTIQNLFVKMIQNHKNLNLTDNVRTYLLRAFRHKLLDALQILQPTESIEELNDFFFVDEAMLNTLFMKDDVEVETERCLAKAISLLSNRQREIIYLYYVKQMTHREIAGILEVNVQSSKNLLSRTITYLRDSFFSIQKNK